PMLLAEYHGSAYGYHLEDIDLTPFLGHPIFLIWNHQLTSSVPSINLGWVLDDVCVSVETVMLGAILVSNNLAQGRATLTGPVSRVAQGYASMFNNVPPGRYRVTWTPVDYYQTPLDQTNTLNPGAFLRVTGLYTLSDVNSNGMSDAW